MTVIPAADTATGVLGAVFLGWELWIWAAVVAACAVAGVVRGFTGFGFPLIVVTSTSLVVAPAEIVPIALLLDIQAGVRMLPSVRYDVDRRGVSLLTLGAIPAIPLGAWLLASLDPESMRLAIGVMVLIAVLVIARGYRMTRPPAPPLLAGTGVAAGLLSGSMGMPGPPVILLYLSSPLPVATLRATSVAFFLVTDIVALAALLWFGLIDASVGWRALVLVPVVELSVLAGRRLYGVTDPAHVKRAAMALLTVLAVIAIAKSVM
ncbi:MAG: sulfite exporter TauE/SafE family protein [Alphaproteobacteria bacterium]|nr:sulfite exporter TauE/SafE family protein [Alphaproteobacteria bacterium]